MLAERIACAIGMCVAVALGPTAHASPSGTIRGKVSMAGLSVGSQGGDIRDAVVFLEGLVASMPLPETQPSIAQKQRAFTPSVLIVPAGTTVAFPNQDVVMHNVFSMAQARPFDLALYPGGMSREVTFDKPGIVPVFCNIHPQMRAHVIVVSNPFFVRPDADGRFELRGVPAGVHTIAAWHRLGKVVRAEVSVESERMSDISLIVREIRFVQDHLNKDGKRYNGY